MYWMHSAERTSFLCFWTGAAPGRLEILWSHHNHKGKGQIWIKRSIFCSCFVFSFAFTPGNFGSLHLCLPHAQSFSHRRCPLVVINEWLMQPNSWNKKIPEARPYGVKTWSAERQSSGSSYDFIKSLSPICPISISLLPSPSFLPPPTPFLLGLTQEVHCCLWLDEVFPQTHVFLTPQTDLALSLFLPEVSLVLSLLVPFAQRHPFFHFANSSCRRKPLKEE